MVDPLVRKECFSVLGLRIHADAQQVRSAYKDLALRFHPDRPTGNADTFKKIQTAYTILLQWFENRETASSGTAASDENSFFSSSTGNFTTPLQRAQRARGATTTNKPVTPSSATTRPRNGSFMNATASSSFSSKPPVDKSTPLFKKSAPKKASTLNAAENTQRAADAAKTAATRYQQAAIPQPKELFTATLIDKVTKIVLDISDEAFRIAGAPGMYHKAPIRRRQDGMRGTVLGALPKDASLYWFKEGTNIPTLLPGRPDNYTVAVSRNSSSPQMRRPVGNRNSSAPSSVASSRRSSLDSASCMEGFTPTTCGDAPKVGGAGGSSSNLNDTLRSSTSSWSRHGDTDPLAATAPSFSTNFHNAIPASTQSAAGVTSFSSKYGSLSASLLFKTNSSPALKTAAPSSPCFSASSRLSEQINKCRTSHASAASNVSSFSRAPHRAQVETPSQQHVPNVRFYRPSLPTKPEAQDKEPNTPTTATPMSSFSKNIFADPMAHPLLHEEPYSPSGMSQSEAVSARSKSSPEMDDIPPSTAPVNVYTTYATTRPEVCEPQLKAPVVDAVESEEDEPEDFGLEQLFQSYSDGNEVEQKETQLRAEILLRYNSFIYEVAHRHRAMRKRKQPSQAR